MEKLIVPGAILLLVIAFLYFKSTVNNGKAQENIKLGEEFLEQNKLKEGVITTGSGLQYEVLTPGEKGGEHPKANSKVKVHYHGTMLDGSVFDSSVERGKPISFGLNQVIKGWTEGVQLMTVGEKARFYIPAHLGYGNRSAGKIPPGSLLIFDIELLAIN